MTKLFQSREARDRAYRELLAQGVGKSLIRRSSERNQLLHPQYVEDFIGPEKHDTGFGNTVYKTHFPALYILHYRR